MALIAAAAPWSYGRPYNAAASSRIRSRGRIQGIRSSITSPGHQVDPPKAATVRPSHRSFVSRFRSVFSFLSLQFNKLEWRDAGCIGITCFRFRPGQVPRRSTVTRTPGRWTASVCITFPLSHIYLYSYIYKERGKST